MPPPHPAGRRLYGTCEWHFNSEYCGRAALQGRVGTRIDRVFSPWGSLMCLAVPGRIVEITDTGDIAFRVGKVDFGGIRKEINLAYTPEAEVGKYVLVHVGFAISVIDEEEAQRVFKILEEMGAVKEELGELPQ